MSILKLEAGRTYELALKRTVAKESTGYTGIQFLYTLASPPNHVLYLPPAAHAEIQSLHLEPGECFSLRKTIEPNNSHVYTVERIQTEPVERKPVGPAVSISTPNNGAIPIPPSLTTPQSVKLFLQLCAVVQSVKAAEEFGKSIGREVKFESADIRAMAISGFIDEQSRKAA